MDKKAHLAGGWLPLGLSSTRMTHQSSFVPTGRMWGWQDGQNCKFVEGTYGAYIQVMWTHGRRFQDARVLGSRADSHQWAACKIDVHCFSL
eukprot:scaffold275462_cov14-Tisochrysis_lutea.AAC.1